MSNEGRNKKILKLRGKKSMGLIALEMGVTRNAVAGVFFRADWPVEARIPSEGGHSPNKIGTGHNPLGWRNRADKCFKPPGKSAGASA